MIFKKLYPVVGLFSVLALCSGCTGLGLAVGAGAKTGIEAAKEGGIPRAVSDLSIQTQINNLWFQKDLDIFRKLDLTVSQGRVLVTGVVQDSHHRVEAIRLAWQPNGVKQVINEIKVAESEGITGFARDVWITTQLKTKLTLDKEVQSINYSIDTVQGTVYLMGVARNQAELNKVIDQARTVSGVKEVVSYVKFAGQPLTQDTLNAPAPSQQDYQNYEPAAGQPVQIQPYQGVSPYSNSPQGLAPEARPEPYVENDNLPPPGQWASPTGDVTYNSGNGGNAGAVRESVQVYPLNN
ncbi:MAG: BON domain-containing protein [Bdellovibrionales bacterium]